MLNADFYNLIQSLWSGFAVAMRVLRTRADEQPQPLPPLWQLRAGLAESPGWFMVQAREFDPQPLTVENLRVRDIYASERIVQALLELMAGELWLERRGSAYFLTDLGRELGQTVRERSTRWLAPLAALHADEMTRLEQLMAQVLRASAASATRQERGVWIIRVIERRGRDTAVTVKLFQYIADFNAFRDDAHMAAWQPLGIDGRCWEAFSLVGSGRAATAVAIYEQLAYRGYSRLEYADALRDLAERGWLETADNNTYTYTITSTGQTISNQVEQLTDEYFYSPWAVFNEAEISEMRNLIVFIGDELQAL